MKLELDQKLCEKYPTIFKDRHAPMDKTAMCWGFECGDGWYDIIDALCAIIDNHIWNQKQHAKTIEEDKLKREKARAGDWSFLYERGENWNQWLEDPINLEKEKNFYLASPPFWMRDFKEPCEVVATQVKEKFGTLRFYVNGSDEYVDGAISMAEHMSAKTCEICGQSGKIRNGGWVRTLCDSHATEYGYNLEEDNNEF